MIHPKILSLAPLVITDIPRDIDTFIQFLTLTGEGADSYWNDDNIEDELHTDSPSYFCIPEGWDEEYFRYHQEYYPSDAEDYPHYTAQYIISLLQNPLYKRPSRS